MTRSTPRAILALPVVAGLAAVVYLVYSSTIGDAAGVGEGDHQAVSVHSSPHSIETAPVVPGARDQRVGGVDSPTTSAMEGATVQGRGAVPSAVPAGKSDLAGHDRRIAWRRSLPPLLQNFMMQDRERRERGERGASQLRPILEDLLAKEQDDEFRSILLSEYGALVKRGQVDRTPAVLTDEVRRGRKPNDPPVGVPMGILGDIGDDVAVDIFMELLPWADTANPADSYQFNMLRSLVLAASDTHSPRLAPQILRIFQRTGYLNLEALGNIADPAFLDVIGPKVAAEAADPEKSAGELRRLAWVPAETDHPAQWSLGITASEVAFRIETNTAPDRGRRLLEILRAEGAIPGLGGVKSPHLYYWALGRAKRLDLRAQGPALQAIYEEAKAGLENPALVHHRQRAQHPDQVFIDYPNETFHVAWLDALYRLGVVLSAEEIDYLAVHGRLR